MGKINWQCDITSVRWLMPPRQGERGVIRESVFKTKIAHLTSERGDFTFDRSSERAERGVGGKREIKRERERDLSTGKFYSPQWLMRVN